MLAAQLFKNVGIRAPAGLGLFAGRQHQLLEQHLAELLWRIDVELVPRQLPYLILKLGDARIQALAEIVQRLAVNEEARALHARQNRAERQLGGIIKLSHPKLREFALHNGLKQIYGLRAVQLPPQIAHGYSLKSVGALRRVEQVGGQFRIEYEPVQRQMLGQEPLHHGFDAVAALFYFRGKNQPQQRRILIAIGVPAHRVHSLAVAYLYAVKPVFHPHGDTFRRADNVRKLLHRQVFHARQTLLGVLHWRRGLALRELPFLYEFIEAEALEKRVKLRFIRLVPDILVRLELKRDVPVDSCKPV